MTEPRDLNRRDWMIAALFFAAAFALRVPFRSLLAYHSDGAQFAMAMENFDMAAGQPHAPGFFLYVLMGRLVNMWLGDPHASLVWISVVFGSALPALGYLLGRALFGCACGVGTGAILATSLLAWFHSEIALTNIVDSTLVTATMLVGWRSMQRGGSWGAALLMAGLFAGVAGVRQQTAPVLLPAWLYAFSKFRRPRWPKVVLGLVAAVVFCLLWFVPLVSQAGGWREYRQFVFLKGRFDAPKTVWGGGMDAGLDSFALIAGSCWVGLLLAGVIAVIELMRWVFVEQPELRRQWYVDHREQLWLLALWILPMAGFGIVVYTSMAGYVLSYFPAVAILAGLATARFAGCWANRLRAARPDAGLDWEFLCQSAVVTAVVVSNCAVFLFAPRWVGPLLRGMTLTAREIRAHDDMLTQLFEIVRSRHTPDNVVICHGDQFFFYGFRQFQYYLPEYRNLLLVPDPTLPGQRGRKLWLGYEKRTEFVSASDVLPGTDAILVVPDGCEPDMFEKFFDLRNARMVEGTEGRLYVIPAKVSTQESESGM